MSLGHSRRRVGGLVVRYGLLLIVAAVFLVPLLVMFVGSVKPDLDVLAESSSLKAFWPAQIENNYADAFATSQFGRLLLNSLIVSGSVVVLGTFVNSMAGYALAWVPFKGRRLLLGVVVALVIVPFQAVAIPLLLIVSNVRIVDSYIVQILPFIASPFFIFLFYSFFLGLPRELFEASRIDGADVVRAYISIALPLIKPAIATSAILSFLASWGGLLWPVMVTRSVDVRPVTVGLSQVAGTLPTQWGDIMAMSVAISLPILVVFLIFQPAFIRSIASSGLKG
jgi:multiple sugar transport system permease protein